MSLGLDELLALENQRRRSGTGLRTSDLVGCWQLQRVWSKGSRREAVLGGWLLRGLAARLEISAVERADKAAQGDDQAAVADPALQLSNAVNLGLLELRFHGPGRLQGRRPLLMFQFDQLQLIVAGRVVLQRQLPAPVPTRVPFFALISREPEGWLSARGRGGGLAQWRLQRPLADARAQPELEP
jgi:hypothetical protein